ncbi:hypothetical protein PIB30_039919 [Stylosanthes scabra]|uniref:Uncharacterized protein n=1 Tax=Stylosanthes scabra TaxID=79078 RepID=A0ABU6QDU5_9FABA|nr:hypothetical protein [Stylosanthes scabra]
MASKNSDPPTAPIIFLPLTSLLPKASQKALTLITLELKIGGGDCVSLWEHMSNSNPSLFFVHRYRHHAAALVAARLLLFLLLCAIYMLKTGTKTSKQNAACALLNLTLVEESKSSIGAFSPIPPLVSLLKNGSSCRKKDAMTTLYKLCSLKQNK